MTPHSTYWSSLRLKVALFQVNATVWIGLTRENPDPVGTWVWTLSEDTATTFSNWQDGEI